jgi:hypothetical protein
MKQGRKARKARCETWYVRGSLHEESSDEAGQELGTGREEEPWGDPQLATARHEDAREHHPSSRRVAKLHPKLDFHAKSGRAVESRLEPVFGFGTNNGAALSDARDDQFDDALRARDWIGFCWGVGDTFVLRYLGALFSPQYGVRIVCMYIHTYSKRGTARELLPRSQNPGKHPLCPPPESSALVFCFRLLRLRGSSPPLGEEISALSPLGVQMFYAQLTLASCEPASRCAQRSNPESCQSPSRHAQAVVPGRGIRTR